MGRPRRAAGCGRPEAENGHEDRGREPGRGWVGGPGWDMVFVPPEIAERTLIPASLC